ncbi:MAG: hypothetical protein CMM26_02480 [Rhodospirillaceae bacterium]|nr:hypothetical protein [Rhodospirillaceae bacterium]
MFGRESTLASRAALAAARQGKYAEVHLALMDLRATPAFSIGDQLIPGAPRPKQMRQLIAEQRSS